MGCAIPVTSKGYGGDIQIMVGISSVDGGMVTGVEILSHGETPGLGAEITTDKVQSSFVGKTIFEGAELVSVSMRKGGATNNHEVDAISGGTKTCDGVNAMLKTCLEDYLPYLNTNKSN